MAIGDTIDMTDTWSVERVAAIDESLESDGLPALTDLRRTLSKVIRRVVADDPQNDAGLTPCEMRSSRHKTTRGFGSCSQTMRAKRRANVR